ncbi:hypothetical protein [Rhodohalobacter sp. 614A]|uniref:hypothetical protein n=1 Tax=Rhodohalobacter sp. 614A TaxID=2908649 RepID=UPI001F1701CC|nr:hypothetical protein [Rhodohalobacter sp. 614A]
MLLVIVPLSGIAQHHSPIGVSIYSDFFPGFKLHKNRFTGSSVYSLQLSFYDRDYTRMEYTLHYSRGYDSSISHSVGLSAAYVIGLSNRFLLKPGLGLDGYKLTDRSCHTTFRSILNKIFDIYEPCDDDIHTSFNPFLAFEARLSEHLSLFIRTSYRLMLSSTDYVKETITETAPNGEEITRDIHGTEHSVYGAGYGIGMGLRINF